MAIQYKHVCDRCGKEMKYWGWTTGLFRNKIKVVFSHNGAMSGEYLDREYELCVDCTKEFKEFLKGERK